MRDFEEIRAGIVAHFPHLATIRDNKCFAQNACRLAAVSTVTPSEYWSLAQMAERRMIPLKDWAVRHGIAPATARQKALRGGFKTAEKVGRDWMIDADEPHVDLRTERTKK